MISEGDKASAPMTFSRDPKRGFQVPHHWLNDTCVVIIDLVKDQDDTMKLSEIAFTSALIMNLCIARPGHANLGGSELSGPALSMKVIVAGRQKAKEVEGSGGSPTLEIGWQGNSSVSGVHETA